MATLEDDHAELENYPLSNWQPVKIISKCRSYALKLPLPHDDQRSQVGCVAQWLERWFLTSELMWLSRPL